MSEDRKDMKSRITEVSIALFEKQGFSDTSVQDICEALDVTKGTFYYYFDSKETLLMDIHRLYIETLLAEQESILANVDVSHREKVFRIVYMLVRDIEKRGASGRVFFREMRHLNEARRAIIVPLRNRFRLNIEDLLEDGKRRGAFRQDVNSRIAAFAILGMANWSYNWFHPGGELTDYEVAEMFVEMVLGGIESGT